MWWAVSMNFREMLSLADGDALAARAILDVPAQVVSEFGDLWTGNANGMRAVAALAAGEVLDAEHASALCWERQLYPQSNTASRCMPICAARAALGKKDVPAARRRARTTLCGGPRLAQGVGADGPCRVLIAGQAG